MTEFLLMALALPRTPLTEEYKLLMEFVHRAKPGYEIRLGIPVKPNYEKTPFLFRGLPVYLCRKST